MPLILPLWCPRLTGGDIRATGYYPWGLGASNVSPFHASLAPGVDQTTFKFQPKTSEKMANRIIIIAVRVCEWVQWWLVGWWGGWALYYQIGSWQFLCVVVPQLQLQLQLHLRLEFKSETEPRSCTSSLAEAVASMEALLVTRDLVTWWLGDAFARQPDDWRVLGHSCCNQFQPQAILMCPCLQSERCHSGHSMHSNRAEFKF